MSRRHQIRPATLDELAALTLAMPPRCRLAPPPPLPIGSELERRAAEVRRQQAEQARFLAQQEAERATFALHLPPLVQAQPSPAVASRGQ